MKLVKKIDIFLVGLIFLITFFISVIGGILLFLLYVLLNNKFTFVPFVYVIFIFSLISFTQYSTFKEGYYDMVRYYSHYMIFSDLNWNSIKLILFENRDVFFYFLTFLLSKIYPDDPRMMAFLFMFLTSINNYLSWKYYLTFNSKKLNIEISFDKIFIILWICSFFLILNFPNLTNAYRQYFALSLFFLAISRKLLGKKYILFIILSILTHWSMLIYLIIFLFIKYIKNNYKIAFILGGILYIFINLVLPFVPFFGDKIASYTGADEILGVDKTTIIINIVIQFFLLMYIVRLKITNDYLTVLLALIFYTIIFITNSTIIIRHFFFVSNYILVVILFNNILLNKRLNKDLKRNLYYTIIILATLFLNIKQMYLGSFNYWFFSKQWYSMSAYEILTTPFPYEIIR